MNIELSSDQAFYLGELLERERGGWYRAYAATDYKVMAKHYVGMTSDLLVQLRGDDLELEEVGK